MPSLPLRLLHLILTALCRITADELTILTTVVTIYIYIYIYIPPAFTQRQLPKQYQRTASCLGDALLCCEEEAGR
jgi:hypothetical protein